MKNDRLHHLCLALLLALGSAAASAAGPAPAAPAIDPPQWTTPDTTPQMHYRTSKKEAGAAYQEARQQCKKLHGEPARACNQEARTNFDQDMALAREKLQTR